MLCVVSHSCTISKHEVHKRQTFDQLSDKLGMSSYKHVRPSCSGGKRRSRGGMSYWRLEGRTQLRDVWSKSAQASGGPSRHDALHQTSPQTAPGLGKARKFSANVPRGLRTALLPPSLVASEAGKFGDQKKSSSLLPFFPL